MTPTERDEIVIQIVRIVVQEAHAALEGVERHIVEKLRELSEDEDDNNESHEDRTLNPDHEYTENPSEES